MEGLYIESSALTSILLEDSREFDAALESVNRPILSALTLLEARRAIRRDSRAGRIDAQAATKLLRRIRSLRTRSQVLPIDDHVLEQAEQDFHVEPVR
ncbi:MAG: PIN domain-containing protein, partial [Candidatus Sericytochromatia bacterium]|nr:PIN domain-containing protein [Candidatus Tanganyikabacteria bacterium]